MFTAAQSSLKNINNRMIHGFNGKLSDSNTITATATATTTMITNEC